MKHKILSLVLTTLFAASIACIGITNVSCVTTTTYVPSPTIVERDFVTKTRYYKNGIYSGYSVTNKFGKTRYYDKRGLYKFYSE